MGVVTFNNKGRLGNYLFEIAAAQSYAIDHDLKFTIPFPPKSNFWNPIYFPWLYKNHAEEFAGEVTVGEDEYFNYKPIPYYEKFKDCKIILDGYFQSEKYFAHNKEEIFKTWKLGGLIQCKGWVGVHIRRGDYLKYPDKHILITKDWILKAMELFPDYKFMFFSDEPDYIIKHIVPGLKVQYSFSTQKDPMKDFEALAICEHQIISPSTFGWWAAYLNPNPDKLIVIPNNWFQPTFKDNGNSIIPESWLKLTL